MERWILLSNFIETEKQEFNKINKLINKNRYIRPETVKKHLITLIEISNRIRGTLKCQYEKLVKNQRDIALKNYWEVRDKLLKTLVKYKIDQKISHSLDETIVVDLSQLGKTSNQSTYITNNRCEEYFEPILFEETKINIAQKIMNKPDFLRLAASIVGDFDGQPQNLQSFIDSLEILKEIMDGNEQLAVALIKTKLKGDSRKIITNETTIDEIQEKLKSKCKGESARTLQARIKNVRQDRKTANDFCSEIQKLTKQLEIAYITDGVPSELASTYSAQVAVDAFKTNASNPEVKMIMKSGQFDSLESAVSKFMESSNDIESQPNNIMFYKKSQQKTYNKNYNPNNNYNYNAHGRGRGRGQFRGNRRFNNNKNNTNYNNRNGYRNRQNRESPERNNRNIRVIQEEQQSENE